MTLRISLVVVFVLICAIAEDAIARPKRVNGGGASNGAELGDPEGIWVAPEEEEGGHEEEEEDHGEHEHEGDASLEGIVFNPGDPAPLHLRITTPPLRK